MARARSSARVLYAAYRHDPRNPDLASGADYRFASALQGQGFEMRFSGPVVGPAWAVERLLRRFYRRLSGRDYTKFPLSLMWRSARQLQRAANFERPDVIFTLFPPPLALYRGSVPVIYRLDTTFLGWQEQCPEFGRLALELSVWQERRALAKAQRLITHSEWTRELLLERYAVPAEKIRVWPNPASLPKEAIPPAPDLSSKMPPAPLRLLLVGRNPHRKGIDVAIEIFRQLRKGGLDVELTVCGASGDDEKGLHFVGSYRKSLPGELHAYTKLYQRAHLLLHPARFDPSPIVVSEAAAFATPTVTNACGGLATSVIDGETGIVLPRGSAPALYAEAIQKLVADRARYLEMCRAARARYERELNWRFLGERLGELVREVAGGAH